MTCDRALMLGSSFPELLAAAQGGDEQAFAVLWRHLQPALLRYFQVVAPPAPDDPVAQMLEGQSTRAALALLAQLSADQAEVVALRVLGGLEVAEVARIVGKRPGAVRVLAHRGLRRLANLLKSAELARGVTR
jgi:hypothetical protein